METNKNFIEVEGIEEANKVDMNLYRLLSYSDRTGIYVFQLRTKKV